MSLKLSADSQTNHDRFLKLVRANRQVWGLRSIEGWAVCPSNQADDVNVFVFWSDRAYAARHVHGEWADYVPRAIALDDFLAEWLPGMARDGVLVGTNWDANLCGVESTPTELAARLSGLHDDHSP
jgi:hypothetical protein